MRRRVGAAGVSLWAGLAAGGVIAALAGGVLRPGAHAQPTPPPPPPPKTAPAPAAVPAPVPVPLPIPTAAALQAEQAVLGKLAAALEKDPLLYQRLAYMCDTFGPRLSGTPNLERAIDWVLTELRRDGLESVRGEPVEVPHWVRGTESATLVSPREQPLGMLGLGGSIATPPEGITAEVLVVRSFDELTARAAEAKGRIVVFAPRFTTYGDTVAYRGRGASRAAQVGAVAALVRSMAPESLHSPHTGAMRYDPAQPRIPAAAITLEDAELLARLSERGARPKVRLQMGASQLPPAASRNVIAELRGRERPDEIVVIGGHIDSWDVGQGAHDDAGSCIATWHALRALKQLGLRPRRTVRVVMWTNEENGLAGGKAYAAAHAPATGTRERHVLGIEADSGAFRPTGFYFAGAQAELPRLRALTGLLAPIQATEIVEEPHGAGADVDQLHAFGVPTLGLRVAGERYFWYHHSAGDTVDKVDPRELAQMATALGAIAHAAAEL